MKFGKKQNKNNQLLLLSDRFLYRSSQISLRRKFLSVLLFIVIGLLLSFLILISLKIKPQSFFQMFTRLFTSTANTQNFLYQISIYVMAALAFSFAMNVGIFNIGISGQMLAGASTAVLLISVFPKSFTDSVAGGGQIITLLFSIMGAVTVALITGLLKIYLKVNEVVTAILLNWIILFIVAYLVQTYDLDEYAKISGNFQSKKVPEGFSFLILGSAPAFIRNSGWLISMIVTVISVVVIWVLMKFTVFGHKLKTTGLSTTASKYFGYNQNYLQLASFAISGALAGILGAIVYTGQENYLNFNSVGKTALTSVPMEGFNGIAIGLIALNNPIAIVAVSILFSLINVGAAPAGLPSLSTVSLVTGIMMYMIAIYKLSMYLRPWRWFYLMKYGKMNSESYLNFENYMAANTERYRFNLLNQRNEIIERHIKKRYLDYHVNKFSLFWIRLYLKSFGFHFVKEGGKLAYALAKQEVMNEYFTRRHEIINEFKYSCSYSLIIWWEQRLNNWNSNKGKCRISTWEQKDRKNVVLWMKAVQNPDIRDQLIKHLDQIDSKVAITVCNELLTYWQTNATKISQNPHARDSQLLLAQWNDDNAKIIKNINTIKDQQLQEQTQKQYDLVKQQIASFQGGNQ